MSKLIRLKVKVNRANARRLFDNQRFMLRWAKGVVLGEFGLALPRCVVGESQNWLFDYETHRMGLMIQSIDLDERGNMFADVSEFTSSTYDDLYEKIRSAGKELCLIVRAYRGEYVLEISTCDLNTSVDDVSKPEAETQPESQQCAYSQQQKIEEAIHQFFTTALGKLYNTDLGDNTDLVVASLELKGDILRVSKLPMIEVSIITEDCFGKQGIKTEHSICINYDDTRDGDVKTIERVTLHHGALRESNTIFDLNVEVFKQIGLTSSFDTVFRDDSGDESKRVHSSLVLKHVV